MLTNRLIQTVDEYTNLNWSIRGFVDRNKQSVESTEQDQNTRICRLILPYTVREMNSWLGTAGRGLKNCVPLLLLPLLLLFLPGTNKTCLIIDYSAPFATAYLFQL